MKLEKNHISVETNNYGEIISLKYDADELLHQGEKWWNKTYPMIWPVISFSNGFIVNKKNYILPKHGFWKDLSWQIYQEKNALVQLATYLKNDVFPFSIDIENKLTIVKNTLIIKTSFTNFGQETAFFHFGHHPAFKINLDTKIKSPNQYQKILLDGRLSKEKVAMHTLMQMPFGTDFDTLVAKDVQEIDETITFKNYDITVWSKDFNSVQIWKKPTAQFVCIEPWQGWNDREYDAPQVASEKLDIIKLLPSEKTEFEIKIIINKRFKAK